MARTGPHVEETPEGPYWFCDSRRVSPSGRKVFTTCEDERLGAELVPRIGVDNVMWASDYPHGDSTWRRPWPNRRWRRMAPTFCAR
jgi:hypothetical protein